MCTCQEEDSSVGTGSSTGGTAAGPLVTMPRLRTRGRYRIEWRLFAGDLNVALFVNEGQITYVGSSALGAEYPPMWLWLNAGDVLALKFTVDEAATKFRALLFVTREPGACGCKGGSCATGRT